MSVKFPKEKCSHLPNINPHLNFWEIFGDYWAALGFIQPLGIIHPQELFIPAGCRIHPGGISLRGGKTRVFFPAGIAGAQPALPVIPPRRGAGLPTGKIPPGESHRFHRENPADPTGKIPSARMRPPELSRCWALLLLLALLSDAAGGRRGAGGRSAGPGGLRGGFRALSRGGGSPGRGSKVAGAVAAGAAAGYGMGLLGRPRPARLGHGIPAARQPPAAGGFHAGGWPEAGGRRGPPSRAPGRRRAGLGLALLLAAGACLLSHGLQR
ncbi:uncharacterized protein [Taeniopygia guttata]|uniref:uncharacterized protein n=1 Tax=Taeniopygia guttata TaxID=59729 RepID=UPI003BB95D75